MLYERSHITDFSVKLQLINISKIERRLTRTHSTHTNDWVWPRNSVAHEIYEQNKILNEVGAKGLMENIYSGAATYMQREKWAIDDVWACALCIHRVVVCILWHGVLCIWPLMRVFFYSGFRPPCHECVCVCRCWCPCAQCMVAIHAKTHLEFTQTCNFRW